MSNPWDNICEWMRSHGDNIAGVLNNLANQGTYSDIGSPDQLSIQPSNPFSMTQGLILGLVLVWAALLFQSRHNHARDAKPRPLDDRSNQPPTGGIS